MKKYLLMIGILTHMGILIAMEDVVFNFPTVPHAFLKHTDKESYPADCLKKANEAYDIFHSGEELDSQTIKKGIDLLVDTAQAGDPYSLENLAYIALYGQYGISENIEWAADMLIYLAQNELTDAWNVLNALDSRVVKLIEEGKIEEAKGLFICAWKMSND